jgi:hypothetical protein
MVSAYLFVTEPAGRKVGATSKSPTTKSPTGGAKAQSPAGGLGAKAVLSTLKGIPPLVSSKAAPATTAAVSAGAAKPARFYVP